MEQYRDKLAEQYWVNQIMTYGQFPVLPPAKGGGSVTCLAEAPISAAHLSQLKKHCKDDWHNMFSFLLSAFAISISRYGNSEDFLLLLPLRGTSFLLGMQVDGRLPFRTFFTENRSKLLTALKYTGLAVDDVKRKLEAKSIDGVLRRCVSFSFGEPPVTVADGEVCCCVTSCEDGGAVVSISCAGGYSPHVIQELAGSFVTVLTAMVDDPGKNVREYPVLPPEWLQHMANAGKSVLDDVLLSQSIVDRFAEQVRLYPDNTALEINGLPYTFEALNNKAGDLARLLHQQYRRALAAPVAVMQQDVMLLVTSILAVLKAGAVFIAVRPDQWQCDVVKEAAPQLLITDSQGIFNELPVGLDMLAVDLELAPAGAPDAALPSFSHPSDAAFILPAGTAAQRSGLIVTHRNVMSLLVQGIDAVAMTPADKVVCTYAAGSGTHLLTLLQSLLSGAVFISGRPQSILSLSDDTDLGDGNFSAVVRDGQLQLLIVSKEDDSNALTDRGNNVPFYHLCTDGAIGYTLLKKGGCVQPVGSIGMCILNKNGELLPDEVEGEIYIHGGGVVAGRQGDKARQYQLPESPFRKGEWLFRTGDTGYRQQDGCIVRSAPKLSAEPGPAATAEALPANTETQHLFMALCRQVLGVASLGPADDFFAAGGDSIKAISVISGLSKSGYDLDLKEVFTGRTIGKIAACIQPLQHRPPQSAVTGLVALTPIQRKFFSFSMPRPHFFNQAFMFRYAGRWTATAVEEVFNVLLIHHDALRMTFRKDNGAVIQENKGTDCQLRLVHHDLRTVKDPQAALSDICNSFHQDIDLATGPLMKAGLFHLPDGDRLLISVHHLVVDVVSWKIIFEDIHELLMRQQDGRPLVLPAKTDSCQLWAGRLEAYATDTVLLDEKAYWASVLSGGPARVGKDNEKGSQLVKDICRLGITLSMEETQALAREAGQSGVSFNELLIAALGMAVGERFGNEALLMDLEKHGREPLFSGLNVSRTVGWFTSVYPFRLQMSGKDITGMAQQVSRQFRAVPGGGVGYGVLKYLTPPEHTTDLVFHDKADISFNYLGELLQAEGGEVISMAAEYAGDTLDPELEVPYALDVSGVIMNKMLSVTIAYSSQQYYADTIRVLLSAFHCNLIAFLSYAKKNAVV